MKTLLLSLSIAAGLVAAGPAAADAPSASPFTFSFESVDPCTGKPHSVTFAGTTFRHDHDEGATYHADVTITTSSGYVGRGIEVSVDHERLFVINHVLAKPNEDRLGAHAVIVLDREGSLRVEHTRVTCIGRNA